MAGKKRRKKEKRKKGKEGKKGRKKEGGKKGTERYMVLSFLLLFLGLFFLTNSRTGITGAASLQITPVQNTIIGFSFILGGLFLIGVILFISRVKDKGVVEG